MNGIKKNDLIQIRVNNKEKIEIEKLAKEKNLNLSDFIRYCIMFYTIKGR